jgi:hypothetical protein
MGDIYDAAQSRNDQSKAALIAAIAQHGSQAKAALDQAAAQLQQQKQQAVAAALAAAAGRGAPTELQGQISQTVGQGYDQRLADLASSSAQRQAGFENIGASSGAYFDQTNAAIPALRARAQQQESTLAGQLANHIAQLKYQNDAQEHQGQEHLSMLQMQLQDRATQRQAAADAKAQAEQDRQDRLAQQQALEELQLQVAQANADKAQTSAAQQAAKQDTKAAALVQQKQFDAGQSPPQTPKQYATIGKVATTLNKPGQVAAAANYSLPGFGAAQIAKDAGHPVNTGANPDLGASQVSAAAIKAVSGSKFYKDALKQVKNARDAGATPEQFAQVLTQQQATYGHPFPQTIDVLTRMYAAGQI